MCGANPCDAPLCTWGEAFRRLTEARWVLALPFEARRPYLNAVAKRRGQAAADLLSADVRDEHAAQKHARAVLG